MKFKINTYGNTIEIHGVIKTIANMEAVIDAIKKIEGDTIKIKIYESFGLPSGIIGYLVKLKDKGKQIFLAVKSDILYELMDNLNLINAFNVTKLD